MSKYNFEDFGFVNNFDDEYLQLLSEAINTVKARREAERRERRSNWIRARHTAFLHHPNATHKVLGQTVVVSVYDRYTGIHMGATTPINGDKFELSTGIAVAFAKAMGDRIPDFI